MFNHPNHHKFIRQLAATATLKLQTTSGTNSWKISGKTLVFLAFETAFCNQNLFLVQCNIISLFAFFALIDQTELLVHGHG